ncbi:MAG: HNH endonuclease signature motif containing protein [Gemmatimonadales bacterium]
MAMKLLQESVAASAAGPLPAYYDPQWRRDLAPLLDELACSIDHIEAFSAGGEDDPGNFAAICARCNARKSARPKDAFLEDARPWRVRSKHGEPERWDGMTSVFVSLASTTGRKLTPHESAWLKALQSDPG